LSFLAGWFDGSDAGLRFAAINKQLKEPDYLQKCAAGVVWGILSRRETERSNSDG
jgi:hypothetical protein